jgi:hypothetical protein
VQLIRPVIASGMVGHKASLIVPARESCDIRPCGSHLYKKRKGGPATHSGVTCHAQPDAEGSVSSTRSKAASEETARWLDSKNGYCFIFSMK